MIALDTLEHVHPDDRNQGYLEITLAMAEHARFYLHYSLGVSVHDKQFDHPYGIKDIQILMQLTDMRLILFEEYICEHSMVGKIPYVWAVMER